MEPDDEALRILIVDDNQDIADTFAHLVRLRGHDVRVAYDGEAAMAVASDQMPHLIFLDIGIPKGDGFETFRQLRADPRLSQAEVVAVTSYGDDASVRRLSEARFDEYFLKPVYPNLLLDVVERAANKLRGEKSPT